MILLAVRNVHSVENSTVFVKGIYTVFKASILAVLLTVLLMVVFALLLRYGAVGGDAMQPGMQIIRLISIAAGGIIAARTPGGKGWLRGGITGFLYIAWAVVLSAIIYSKVAFDIVLAVDAVWSILAGAIGGIIGRNLGGM